MAIKIHDNLLKASGTKTVLLDLGPEATFDAPKIDPTSVARNQPTHFNSQEYASSPLQRIWRQTYKNQTVALDGYHYVQCTFDNVTFMYEGTRPMEMTEVTFVGAIAIGSTNGPIKTIIGLAEMLHRATGGKSELRTMSSPLSSDLINPPNATPPSRS